MSRTEGKKAVLDSLLEAVSSTLAIDLQDGSASFLELGGDSLSAIIVTATLQDDDLPLNVEDLFSALPLHRIALLVEARQVTG